MNTKTKRRLIVVSGIIIVVLIVILAVVGGNSAAKTISVAEAASGEYKDQKIQVSGNVVENSFSTTGNILSFDIYDPEGDSSKRLNVNYEGGVSTTFGNDVTAICTGKIDESGTLHASELVTKCPSKYENKNDALSISKLLGYGDEVVDKPVKISGTIKQGSLKSAGQGDRFIVVDPDSNEELAVTYEGALSEEVANGSSVVLTGSLDAKGKFVATVVALEE